MKTKNVLADHMDGRRPARLIQPVEVNAVAVIQQSAQVTEQGVEPHVEGMAGLVGNRQTP